MTEPKSDLKGQKSHKHVGVALEELYGNYIGLRENRDDKTENIRRNKLAYPTTLVVVIFFSIDDKKGDTYECIAGKTIVLGVCGGIAAYKAAALYEQIDTSRS